MFEYLTSILTMCFFGRVMWQQHILGFVTSLKNNHFFFRLCLQLLGQKNDYLVAKDIKMPHDIMVLWL
jgi:hypothetical protein